MRIFLRECDDTVTASTEKMEWDLFESLKESFYQRHQSSDISDTGGLVKFISGPFETHFIHEEDLCYIKFVIVKEMKEDLLEVLDQVLTSLDKDTEEVVVKVF